MTDAELVRQVRNGQASAYEILVRRWSGRLVGYVHARVRAKDVAEDIAQDSFLKAYRGLPHLADPGKFGAWLLSIAHRSTLDWLKARARSEVSLESMSVGKESERQLDRWYSTEQAPDEVCMRQEQRELIVESIDQLPETLRQTLVLYYYQDLTYQELAEQLGVSSATVNARLTKARRMLRELTDRFRSAR